MIPNQQNQKERKPEIASKTKKFHVIIPLIVMLMLICVIAITLVVGEHFGRPSETAELNKDVEQEEEHISAAVDIAETSVGTNLKATFTVSTGEIRIYTPESASEWGTMNKTYWYNFLKKIVDADGNLDAVKTITLAHTTYLPKDSSRLFYPLISKVDYPFTNLTHINNLSALNCWNATSMEEMFRGCSKLEEALMYNQDSNCKDYDGMFRECSALRNVRLPVSSTNIGVTSVAMFYGCSSLEEVELRNWKSCDMRIYVCRMFELEIF